jgi:hypothetical protein
VQGKVIAILESEFMQKNDLICLTMTNILRTRSSLLLLTAIIFPSQHGIEDAKPGIDC